MEKIYDAELNKILNGKTLILKNDNKNLIKKKYINSKYIKLLGKQKTKEQIQYLLSIGYKKEWND